MTTTATHPAERVLASIDDAVRDPFLGPDAVRYGMPPTPYARRAARAAGSLAATAVLVAQPLIAASAISLRAAAAALDGLVLLLDGDARGRRR